MGRKSDWQEFGRLSGPTAERRQQPAGTSPPKDQQQVRVQRTRTGRAGRLVTTITGLQAVDVELKALLKQLKTATGTGGALKEGVIELQGDQMSAALAALQTAGYRPKQVGG